MSWTLDAPTGVYKDHHLSAKIREHAAAQSVFARWAEPERGYGKGKGASVTITQILQLPLATRIGETQHTPTGRPVIQTKQLAVSEWGFKIEGTEFEKNLSHFDINNKFQRMLRDQMRLTMDTMCAEALTGSPIKFVANDALEAVAAVVDTVPAGTRQSTVAQLRNMNILDLRTIHDYMMGTLKIPTFSNGKYVAIMSTTAARGIKSDPEYKDWLAPTTREPMLTGQLPASVENFTIIETNNYDALDNSMDAGVTGEAVFFGADSHFLATVEDPEIRMGIPTDLGRSREVGWVGTIEAGRTWDGISYETGPSRIIHWAGTDGGL